MTPFDYGDRQAARYAAEVWFVVSQVRDTCVLKTQDFLGGDPGPGQDPAVFDDGVLKFTKEWQEALDLSVSVLAGPYLILERDGVVSRLVHYL